MEMSGLPLHEVGVMREDDEVHNGAWVAAITEAERRCVKLFGPGNEEIYAVPWTELVQIRQLVGLAQKGRES
jgi:hypothetical protein